MKNQGIILSLMLYNNIYHSIHARYSHAHIHKSTYIKCLWYIHKSDMKETELLMTICINNLVVRHRSSISFFLYFFIFLFPTIACLSFILSISLSFFSLSFVSVERMVLVVLSFILQFLYFTAFQLFLKSHSDVSRNNDKS